MNYEPVIGFEVHVELATNSKMFCGCPADHFGKVPNTQTCPVCLGLPGALPVPNAKAIEWCIKLGLALGCEINLFSKFDRKNYFYPDLSKAYQLSQYDLPFCKNGKIILSSGKVIRITRVHMEEDTGKLQHSGHETLIDFNRSGVPLVEIVTEPDFRNVEDVDEYLKELQQIVRALGISSADMEKGSMRLEANISVRPVGSTELPKYKVEVKNVNSFRFIKKAIESEIARHIKLLEAGETPAQETRGFREATGETFSQRSKEDAHDYRYFPEPDIPPLKFTQSQVDAWKSELPPLPAQIRAELKSKYTLPDNYISILTANDDMYKLFIQSVSQADPKAVAGFLVNKKYGNKLPSSVDELVKLMSSQSQVSVADEAQIREAAAAVVAANPKSVADYKSGKEAAIFFLIGQIKKQLGNVDINKAKEMLLSIING